MELQQKNSNILIVDDHKISLDGIKALLSVSGLKTPILEANSGSEALELINSDKQKMPDLVISDIKMPEMSGIELTRELKENFPNIKVLILTMHNNREIVNQVLHAEAEGYILKNAGQEELVLAINHIMDNGSYYSNELCSIIVEKKRFLPDVRRKTAMQLLTERENEILKLICKEYSNNEIAEKFFISKHTVETHRKHIMRKTKAKSIVGLIRYALENSLFHF